MSTLQSSCYTWEDMPPSTNKESLSPYPDTELDLLDIYLNSLPSTPRLTPDSAATLAREYKEGITESGTELALRMTKLVVAVVTRTIKDRHSYLSLIQVGNLALYKAMRTYNPDKSSFTTHAWHTVRGRVLNANAKDGRLIHLPDGVIHNANLISSADKVLTQKHGRLATTAEIATELGWTEQKVTLTLRALLFPVSLDELMENQTTSQTEKFFAPDQPLLTPDPMKSAIRDLLPHLSPKQQEVISLRYGLEDGETHTLEYIARLMRLSVNGVRNIESAALRTLRNPNITLRLRDHLPT
ncbi:MAG: RNA polymerase sigma factor [Microgenomates group bacterium GW2011_GWF2_47_9]|nr:MAG: RNA polymerase sigma factor [Microgenomates group bacterium GW2011_GWF2_47_9]